MPSPLVLRNARTAPGADPVDLPISGDRIDADPTGGAEIVDVEGDRKSVV